MYNICDFGAVGDGKSLNTAAIQAALDKCGAAGGGRVVVPPGCFVSGTLWLRDRTELHLESGAVLLASPNLKDYNRLDAYPQNFAPVNDRYEDWTGAHLILGVEIQDAAITGPGVIDGNATAFFGDPVPFYAHSFIWRDGLATARDRAIGRPGQMIVFCESRNIRIRDLTLHNATCWSCFLHGCEDVFVRGVKVDNASYACNTDGIDIDACQRVTVSDCIIDSGDDAFAIRGAPRRLKDKTRICSDVVITNCVVASSSSVFRIGVGEGEIRNVLISNIVIMRGGIGIHFNSAFTRQSKGVTISNVRFRDVMARNVAYPLVVDGGHEAVTARIENVAVDGMYCESFAPIRIAGNAGRNVQDVVLRNMEIVVVTNPVKLESRDAYPSNLIEIHRTGAVTLDNVRVRWTTTEPNWKRALHVADAANVDITKRSLLPDPETVSLPAQPPDGEATSDAAPRP